MIKILKNITFSGLLWLNLFIFSYPLHSQNYTFTQIGIYYYNNLDKDEFFNFMLPKEKFLLYLVENISTEIHDRGIKGELGSEIGIDEIIPREVEIMDNYEEEINKIVNLFDEIKLLEKKARQKVDLEILNLLSDLKKRVEDILEENRVIVNPQTDSLYSETLSNKKDSTGFSSSQIDKDKKGDLEFFDDWKYDRLFNYKLKLMKYKLLRYRLLSTSSPAQKQRMFRRYLHTALKKYEDGEFRLTRLLFKDIISTYKQYYLDDVLFYYGESCYGLNYLDEAASCYVRLFNEYPESSYLKKSFIKLIYIYYIYNNFDKMFSVYQNFLQLKGSIHETEFSAVSYLMGYALYKKGDYKKAIDVLKNVSQESSYYYPSLYLAATCCSNIGRMDYTISLYKKIYSEILPKNNNPIWLQIRNNAILKLGLIYFDQGKPELSEKYLNQIPENYSQYDLSLLGKAWSAYQSGDPIKTLENTQQLIQGNMLSQYSYEARLLAAYSKNILGRTEEAVKDLKTAYQVGQSSSEYENLNRVEKKYDESSKTDKLLNRLSTIADFLYSTGDKSQELKPLIDKLHSGSDIALRKKIATLDSLEQKADSIRDEELKNRIRILRNKLLETYKEQSPNLSLNYSRSNVSANNIDQEEYLDYYFSSLLTRILQEKEKIKSYIDQINKNCDLAKEKDDFLTVSRAEIKLSELYAYYNSINKYEVWLRENYPEKFQVNLDQWAYYSGYGISDINFARIKQLDANIREVSYALDVLDDTYIKKQVRFEEQVKGLLKDISQLEQQIQKESVRKKHKKREEFFKNEYFDKQLKESIIGEIEENIGNIKKNEKE
ncbi:MAG: CDC27 family protein [bacterium]